MRRLTRRLGWLGWLAALAWIGLAAESARSAEVVWIEPPTDAQRAAAAVAAGARGPALDLVDLRAARSRFTDEDDAALRDLAQVLADCRPYEQVLDGEVLILRDLVPAIGRVGVLRDDADRNGVYAALLYAGFAAERYFGDQLGASAESEPHTARIAGLVVERAWLDAAALEPDRPAGPYEIGEAPQRLAYEELRERLGRLAPATLTPVDLPPEARLVVDGRPVDLGPAGNVKVRPGRHLVHAELDGRIVARWDVRVEPARDQPLTPEVGEAAWQRFVSDPLAGPPPPEIGRLVEALGGEVWLMLGDERPVVVTPTAVRQGPPIRAGRGQRSAPASVAVGGLAGWLTSGDFYLQDPVGTPRTVAAVNALTVGGFLDGRLRVSGPVRAGAGVDLLVPLGRHHVALTGDRALRPRPVPYVAAGTERIDLAVGFVAPYHLAGGAHLSVPLPGDALFLRAAAWAGTPFAARRADGSRWEGQPLATVSTGLGVRVR